MDLTILLGMIAVGLIVVGFIVFLLADKYYCSKCGKKIKPEMAGLHGFQCSNCSRRDIARRISSLQRRN